MVAAERSDIANAEIGHGATYLGIENGDRTARAGLTRGTDAVERGAANRHRVGTERQTLQNVAAPPEARIDDDLQPGAGRRGDMRQHLDRNGRGIEHVASMV